MIELKVDDMDRAIINGAFRNKVDVDKMKGDDAQELSVVTSNLTKMKDRYCRLVKKFPESTNIYLRLFGHYVKYQGRIFNAEEYSEEKVMFSGLLGRYMREIKNASMENRK